MSADVQELMKRVEKLEKYFESLIEINLELIEEEEAEDWEIKDLEKRRKDEFVDWESVKDEL
ncbi:conserved hypothetical protein [Ferroglobus placidus DSM 10642]|uniref:Uncharacterized protein n=1 Tax=Ferroglobus placidus (strain DSM 10642 / AEDII12DO) TaxID=589924 RepID=D3RXD8_FERPA|nr:hypothetical protein [Ferroglobus placidus]ADC65151.1 conserved hypothetical protein [Ferroglobus placidus DSM 10642]